MPKDPIKTLEMLEKNLEKRVARVLMLNVTRLKTRLKKNLLAGGALQKRTKGLPVIRVRPRKVGNIMEAGVKSPVPWARVHFGPRGSTTTIRAKGGGFLALPTDFVIKRGLKGRVKSPKRFGGTVIFDGIIWGKKPGKGFGAGVMRQRRAAGERFKKDQLLPLFVLKKSIVVRRRIDPDIDLIQWIKPQFFSDLKKEALVL